MPPRHPITGRVAVSDMARETTLLLSSSASAQASNKNTASGFNHRPPAPSILQAVILAMVVTRLPVEPPAAGEGADASRKSQQSK
jgi:hypothetical protein